MALFGVVDLQEIKKNTYCQGSDGIKLIDHWGIEYTKIFTDQLVNITIHNIAK